MACTQPCGATASTLLLLVLATCCVISSSAVPIRVRLPRKARQPPPPASDVVDSEGLLLVRETSFLDGTDAEDFFLMDEATEDVTPLDLPASLKNTFVEQPGSRIQIMGEPGRLRGLGIPGGFPGMMHVDKAKVLASFSEVQKAFRGRWNLPGRHLSQTSSTGVITQFPTIVVVANICSEMATTTPAAMRGLFFTNSMSMTDYVGKCSRNVARLDESNSYIWPEIITVPCDVVNPSNCAWESWWENAFNQVKARDTEGRLIGKEHWALVIPRTQNMNSRCRFGGVAYTSKSWRYNNTAYSKLAVYSDNNHRTWLHELGHNNRLAHAATPAAEYGDGSCALGSSPDSPCFNAVHRWRHGWDVPIADFSSATTALQPGTWRQFTLPNQFTSANKATFVKIRTDWDPANSAQSYFISLRWRMAQWDNFNPAYNGVLINSWAGTSQEYVRPIFLRRLEDGQVWEHAPQAANSLVVKVASLSANSSATIEVCRRSSTSEICGNGVDDDCDGLIDGEDTSCGGSGTVGARPPPPPKSSSRPPSRPSIANGLPMTPGRPRSFSTPPPPPFFTSSSPPPPFFTFSRPPPPFFTSFRRPPPPFTSFRPRQPTFNSFPPFFGGGGGFSRRPPPPFFTRRAPPPSTGCRFGFFFCGR